MVTFGDLITRNFDGPADEEAGNIISILLMPVIVPIQLVYVTGLGTYKLGKAIKEHNPITYYKDRKNSIERLEKMAKEGINPFTKPEYDYEKNRLMAETNRLTDSEKEEIVKQTESLLKEELSKDVLVESNVRFNEDEDRLECAYKSISKPKKLTLTRKGQ